MRTVLHILTRENDALAAEIVSKEKALPDCTVVTVDLTEPNPDYAAVLKEIFAADAVAVW